MSTASDRLPIHSLRCSERRQRVQPRSWELCLHNGRFGAGSLLRERIPVSRNLIWHHLLPLAIPDRFRREPCCSPASRITGTLNRNKLRLESNARLETVCPSPQITFTFTLPIYPGQLTRTYCREHRS